MKLLRLLLLPLLFLKLYAEEPSVFSSLEEYNGTSTASEEQNVQEKLLYLSYEPVTPTLYVNQLFALTVKVLAAKESYQNIYYKFTPSSTCHLVSQEYQRQVEDLTLYDTFYMECNAAQSVTPAIDISLVFENYAGATQEHLDGKPLQLTKLNPPKDFSGLIAKEITLLNFHAAGYDAFNNIIAFELNTILANLDHFNIQESLKQGFDALDKNYPNAALTYYVLMPKELEDLHFSYFNLTKNRFETISFPIEIINDSVTTQSDLKPVDKSLSLSSFLVIGFFILLFTALAIIKRSWAYLLLLILPASYLVYVLKPNPQVCVQSGSYLYLLPMNNAKLLEETSTKQYAEKLSDIENFTKVRLLNQKIGWIKNESLCKN